MLQERILDKNTPVPLYFQLEKLIVEEIENGAYPVGSMIPTEKELSQIFGISRTTVRQAIADLVRKEKLYRIKSKGTFVARPKISQGFIQSIQSFDEDVRSGGRSPSTQVLALRALELKEADLPREVAAQMGVIPGERVIYLYRRRCADGEPIVRVETYLPYEVCGFTLEHDFTKESLYQVLSEREETDVTHITRVCEARVATAEDVSVLNMKRGRPIHYFVSMGRNREGQLIEYSIARYRGDQSRFCVELNKESRRDA